MGEHPARAFIQKPDASVVKGFKLLAHGEIDGFASAGNTGAMMVGAMQVIKSIPGSNPALYCSHGAPAR